MNNNNNNNNNNTFYKSEILKLVPGFCQGLTRVTISYPFDVVKVKSPSVTVAPPDLLIVILVP